MTAPSWNQDLTTGAAEMDGEHRLQVQLVEALEAAVAAGRDRAVLDELLGRLEETSNVHFMGEELLMRFHAWERYDQHTEEHRQLLEELRALRARFGAGDRAALEVDLGRLRQWLAGHVRGMDRAFAAYVARGGLGAA